jgi:uncharacterized protein YjbJ (UPF0337 family)
VVGALNSLISKEKAVSSTSDKGEGKVQEAQGDLQKAVGNAKSAIKKAADL